MKLCVGHLSELSRKLKLPICSAGSTLHAVNTNPKTILILRLALKFQATNHLSFFYFSKYLKSPGIVSVNTFDMFQITK